MEKALYTDEVRLVREHITEAVRQEQIELVDPTGTGASADTDGRVPREPRATE